MLSEEVLDKIGSRLSDSVNLVNDILTITRSVMADLRHMCSTITAWRPP